MERDWFHSSVRYFWNALLGCGETRDGTNGRFVNDGFS